MDYAAVVIADAPVAYWPLTGHLRDLMGGPNAVIRKT